VWVLTKTHWPTLVNLSVLSAISYQQLSKSDTRIRVVGTAWEQELVLAECADGTQAQALVRLLARALADEQSYLDLSAIDLAALAGEPPG
jgi:hypothetical protein